jgi:RteC protein
LGKSHLDPTIFLLQNSQLELLAQVAAAERFQIYLHQRQNQSAPISPTLTPKKSTIIWTDGESHFVELVYGFWQIGAFNDKQITLKALVEALAEAWGVKLTQDVSRTWISLKNRSKGPDLYFQVLANAVCKLAKKQDLKK